MAEHRDLGMNHGSVQGKGLSFVAIVFLILSCWRSSFAQSSIDQELIKKLELVLARIPESDSQRIPVTLRLADLLSEQARQASQREIEQFGGMGEESARLRRKALSHYQAVVNKISDPTGQAKVLIQMGYLWELEKESEPALKAFFRVTELPVEAVTKAEAWLSMGENYYRRGRWLEATKAYDMSLSLGSERVGYVQFRKAWSLFQQGQVEGALQALDLIWQEPQKFLSPQGVKSKVAGALDRDFAKEIARDQVIMLAKGPGLTADRITQLRQFWAVTGQSFEILKTLAYELERTGRAQEEFFVWKEVESHTPQLSDRLLAKGQLAALSLREFKTADFKFYAEAFGALKTEADPQCVSAECQDVYKRWKALVSAEYQKNKTHPTSSLAEVLRMVVDIFPSDLSLRETYAVVLSALGQYDLAATTYRSLAELKTGNADERERLWLLALEASDQALENSKEDQALKERARELRSAYLKASPLRKAVFSVTFKNLKEDYDRADWNRFLPQVREFLGQKEAPVQLRVMAAHLLLDAWAQAQVKPLQIAEEAQHLAQILPEYKNEFLPIAYRAWLNEMSAGSLGPKEAMGYLDMILADPQLSNELRKTSLKNKILVTYKAQQFSECQSSLEQYLALPALAQDEKKWANTWLTDVSEWLLDFKTAYRAWSEVGQADISSELRASVLAWALGNKDVSLSHLKRAYTMAEGEMKENLFFEILAEEKNPQQWVQKEMAWLKSKPSLYHQAIFYLSHSDAKAFKTLRPKQITVAAPTDLYGLILWKMDFYENLISLKKQMKSLKPLTEAKNQTQLKQFIAARVQGITQGEKLAKEALSGGDPAARWLILQTLAVENKKLYEELMSLPLPAGLDEQAQQEYMLTLSHLAKPYLAKATEYDSAASKLLPTLDSFSAYQAALKREPKFLSAFHMEWALLMESLPTDHPLSLALNESLKDSLPAVQDTSKPARVQTDTHLSGVIRVVAQGNQGFSKEEFKRFVDEQREQGHKKLADFLQAKWESLEDNQEVKNE